MAFLEVVLLPNLERLIVKIYIKDGELAKFTYDTPKNLELMVASFLLEFAVVVFSIKLAQNILCISIRN
jgi:hypothetical protein